MPPQGGQYIPPPPQYPAGSDIPPQSPYHYSPAPSQGGSRGAIGWLGSAALAVWAVVKYGLIFAFKIPALATLLSALVSFGAYSLLYGGWFAVALVVMLFVHEMGHVVEIRRQGMHATAPIFIPFLGAAIFQRQHPTDALKQAQIGIAVLGIQTMRSGFRNANNPYYTSVPMQARLALGAAWLGLVIYLGVMSLQAESLFTALAR